MCEYIHEPFCIFASVCVYACMLTWSVQCVRAQVLGALAPPAKFDIILLDILMPRMDGAAVCQELRNRRFNMPIVAMTGTNCCTFCSRSCGFSYCGNSARERAGAVEAAFSANGTLAERPAILLTLVLIQSLPLRWPPRCYHQGTSSSYDGPNKWHDVVAGTSTTRDTQYFVSLGFDVVLPKPFDINDMGRALATRRITEITDVTVPSSPPKSNSLPSLALSEGAALASPALPAYAAAVDDAV